MSVRDRISNLNSLKTPIITAASHDSTHAHPGHSSSSNTSSTENSAEKEGTDGTEVGSSKPSTIAERIAKLKAANAHKDVAVPSPINRIALKSPFPPPSADADSSIAEADATPKGSIKSRIAMLGANINLTAHSANNPNQFNPFAAQSSRGNSETNSRESHLDPHPSLATTGSNLNSSEHTRDKCEIDGDGNALSTSAPIMAGKRVLKGNLVHVSYADN